MIVVYLDLVEDKYIVQVSCWNATEKLTSKDLLAFLKTQSRKSAGVSSLVLVNNSDFPMCDLGQTFALPSLTLYFGEITIQSSR
jgi:hypothetical protein